MDDAISRQAAINAMCTHGTELERRGITVLSVANHKQATVDLLEHLPPAQQWIPVSSGKLPENSLALVLVQIGTKCPDVELAFYDYNRECWENARHYQKISDVVAWMPLPEPWEGETDG